MGRILKDIASDTVLTTSLGFKGGTAAYFFYTLPRFSVDLDFDLLDGDESRFTIIQERIANILKEYGSVLESRTKRFTLFSLLSYGKADHNVKVEINTRMPLADMRSRFEARRHLGLSLFVGKQATLFAGKLAALTDRRETAMRDIYDAWYFAKNFWDIDAELLKSLTGKTIPDHLTDCIALIQTVKDNEILQGLGELLDEREKTWVRAHLRAEAIAMLENYRDSISTTKANASVL